MSSKTKNPVLAEIERLAKKYGYRKSSIASKAFKNSRRAAQLERRDDIDASALRKLRSFEIRTDRDLEQRAREIAKVISPKEVVTERPVAAPVSQSKGIR